MLVYWRVVGIVAIGWYIFSHVFLVAENNPIVASTYMWKTPLLLSILPTKTDHWKRRSIYMLQTNPIFGCPKFFWGFSSTKEIMKRKSSIILAVALELLNRLQGADFIWSGEGALATAGRCQCWEAGKKKSAVENQGRGVQWSDLFFVTWWVSLTKRREPQNWLVCRCFFQKGDFEVLSSLRLRDEILWVLSLKRTTSHLKMDGSFTWHVLLRPVLFSGVNLLLALLVLGSVEIFWTTKTAVCEKKRVQDSKNGSEYFESSVELGLGSTNKGF